MLQPAQKQQVADKMYAIGDSSWELEEHTLPFTNLADSLQLLQDTLHLRTPLALFLCYKLHGTLLFSFPCCSLTTGSRFLSTCVDCLPRSFQILPGERRGTRAGRGNEVMIKAGVEAEEAELRF